MKEDNKISVEALRKKLLTQVVCAEPEKAIETLLSGWVKHPCFVSPTRQTLARRAREDGFVWLKADEITSLEAYSGYELI